MKIIINYNFINKSPLSLTKENFSTTFLVDKYICSTKVKKELTFNELKELTEVIIKVEEISSIEMDNIPDWFFSCKGKLNYKMGKLK